MVSTATIGRMNQVSDIPVGLCQCGCGQKTTIATKNHTANGYVKGMHRPFVQGHSSRKPRASVSTNIVMIEGEPCRYIALTKGKVAIVDADNYERLNQVPWYAIRSISTWYAGKHSDEEPSVEVRMHQFVIDVPVGMVPDHKNGNGLDNRRANLRAATGRQNQGNRRPNPRNTSGFRGVVWDAHARKWKAHIGIGGIPKHIGLFSDKIAAARAYNERAKEHFGEFAKLNDV